MKITSRLFAIACFVSWWCMSATIYADSYGDAVLADSPVAFYRLNETGMAFIADNVASTDVTTDGFYDGFISAGGPGTLGEEGPRPGDITGGFVLDGFDAGNVAPHFGITGSAFPHVEVPESDGYPLDITTGGLTLEAWINRDPDAGSANEGIVSKYQSFGDNSNQRAYNLFYDPDPGQFGLGLSETGANQPDFLLRTNQGVPPGEWAHVAATWEPGVRTAIYVNGQLAAEQTNPDNVPLTLHNSTADVWIGQQFNDQPAQSFEGRIDDVAIYNTALTAAQIGAHFDAAAGALIDSFAWNTDSSGDWNNSANWDSDSIPNGNAVTAVFGSATTSPRTVYTETNVLVNGVRFEHSTSYVLGGTGTLVLESAMNDASIDVTQGSHEIQASVLLQSDTSVAVDSGSLHFDNTLNLNGHTLTIESGGGEVAIRNEVLPGDGGMIINAGSLSVAEATALGGDLINEGGLTFDLGGAGAGDYGSLAVGGSATLSGTVAPRLANGFEPKGGDLFTLLTAGTLVDDGITLEGDLADQMELSVVGNSLVLTASLAVPEPASLSLVAVMAATILFICRQRFSR